MEIEDLDGLVAIAHLASPASPKAYSERPMETILANTAGTAMLLDLAWKADARFLFTSTSETYGEPEEHPQAEGYRGNVSTTGPRACYDESKRLGETICSVWKERGVDIRIARLFNTYGPGMAESDGRVVETFVRQALKGAPLTVHGDGRQTRSFCYVDDTVRGLVKLLEAAPTDEWIFNIGNPDERMISTLAQMILVLADRNGQDVEYLPLPEDDPTRRCPDINRAVELLDWKPEISLANGLKMMINASSSCTSRTSELESIE